MHHGTHEKQLSNVFAWLLSADGTHELGGVFQRLFIEQVNRGIQTGAVFPSSGYRVIQEVDTSGHDALGRDIADIVLTTASASVVIENFESSDGHGHDYHRYLAYGAVGDKQSIVVLLCARRASHAQIDGWENAIVVTYADVLASLKVHVDGDAMWRQTHPQQNFFINELVQHFMEGPAAVSNGDRIEFIKAMCQTGESSRYGRRPHEAVAQEFADLVAQHAKRQFEEGRRTLASLKQALKLYARRTLMEQVNGALTSGDITAVEASFVGQWEWCVTLGRAGAPKVYLEFGPTAAVENDRAPEPLIDPDYTKVFVTRAAAGVGIDQIIQTGVGLDEVLSGLSTDDTRLRDAVLAAISAT